MLPSYVRKFPPPFFHERSLRYSFRLVPDLNQVLFVNLLCRDVIKMLGKERHFDFRWEEFPRNQAGSFNVDYNSTSSRGDKLRSYPFPGRKAIPIDPT